MILIVCVVNSKLCWIVGLKLASTEVRSRQKRKCSILGDFKIPRCFI